MIRLHEKGAAKLASAHGELWACEPSALARLTFSAVDELLEPVIPECREIAATGRNSSGKGVMVVPVLGLLTNRRAWATGTSYIELSSMIDTALAAPSVGTIVFEVDSPGGSVAGVTEAAAKIASASQLKRTIAVINTLGASGAYFPHISM